MQLEIHELRQLDKENLLNLSEEELWHLSEKLFANLKETRERLNQIFHNSFRLLSCETQWEKEIQQNDSSYYFAKVQDSKSSDENKLPFVCKIEKKSKQPTQGVTKELRKAGNHFGVKGFSRQQKLTSTDYQELFPEICRCCQYILNTSVKKVTTTFETIGFKWVENSISDLRLTNTNHTYYLISCCCGHITIKEPFCSNFQDSLQNFICSRLSSLNIGKSKSGNY